MVQKRRKEILDILNEEGKVKVIDLSERLHCSEVTIRNDIKNMEKEGLLKRTHGGALRIEQPKESRKHAVENIYRHVSQKQKIAAYAYEYISDRDTIIIDDSSTGYYLAEYIKTHPEKRLAVVTNALSVASELADVRHADVFMVGGHVGGHLAATMGEVVMETLSHFQVDKAFIGVHSVNFNVGLTSMATPQMEIKRAIFQAAGEVTVLADSSKFGGGYVTVICPLQDVKRIITDDKIEEHYIKEAEKMQISLVVAK